MENKDFGGCAVGLHDKVIELMIEEKRGTVLDAPSGLGELSYLLHKNGFKVIAGDIDKSVCKLKEVDFKQLDLNKELPFEDNSLDYVICVEGVEHLENPHHTIKEFSRILKPGGKAILTTPNVLNIFSRIRYLLIGYHEYFGDHFLHEDNFYVLHINPVGFPELNFILKRNNLEVEKVAMNKSVLFSRGFLFAVLMITLLPVVKIMTKLKVKDGFVKQYMLSKELLVGSLLVLKCKKRGSHD